jgi:uncharacterized membrane protein
MQDKKDLVLGRKKAGQSSGKAIGIIIIALLLAVGGGVYFMNSGNKTEDEAMGQASPTGQTVNLELAQFDDGKARHFSYQVNDELRINFFVLKSSDDIIRAAFDACDVCWRSGKGYVQQGDVMICRNCGQRFASVRVNEVRGGCNPSPLQRMVKDGKVHIKVADILEGRRYFDFTNS